MQDHPSVQPHEVQPSREPTVQGLGGASACHGGIELTAESFAELPRLHRVDETVPVDIQKNHVRVPDPERQSFDADVLEGITITPQALPQTPPPTSSWQALKAGGDFTADAQISVSQTHVVVTTRTTISIWDKSGRSLAPPIYVGTLFQPLATALQSLGIDSYFDTRAIFDAYRNRFWVATLAYNSISAQPGNERQRLSKVFVAVSKTQNPFDGWYLYWWDAVAHDGVPNDPVFQPGDASDYLCLGVDRTCFYTTNKVGNSTLGYRYWHIAFFPADQLANGTIAGGWQFWTFTNPDGRPTGLVQPVVHHGPSPRAYFVSRYAGNQFIIWGLSNALQPTQRVDTALAFVAPFGSPQDAPQKGSSVPISMTNLGTDPIKAVYRDNALYLTTNDGKAWFNDGQVLTSVRLIRLDVSSFPGLTTTIDRVFGSNSAIDDQPSDHMYYGWPAVEVNSMGNMIIVYARSGATIYPEVRYSAYCATDPDIRPSRLLKAGEAPYQLEGWPGAAPWGDTAGASVDPADDATIWITQLYADTHSANNNFALWVGAVRP